MACLYKQSDYFTVQRKNEFEIVHLEALCAEIQIQNNEEILVVVVYIPPNKTEQMTLLSSLLANVCRKYRNVIITGDMNAKSGMGEIQR